jgi:hypothetical protein
MNNQVGRRYIPIMGIGRGKAGLDLPFRNQSDPVGE